MTSNPAVHDLLNLQGKTALVTGGDRGLGRGIALRLAEAGADVIIHTSNLTDSACTTVKEIQSMGRQSRCLPADFSDERAIRSLFEEVFSTVEHIDILINNAGIYPSSSFLDLSLDEWDRVLSIDLRSVFLCTQTFAKNAIARQYPAAIVNIASIESMHPAWNHAHYSSAKAAVARLTENAALELGGYGIRVNAVSPGLIARPGIEEAWPEGVWAWKEAAPLKRMGEPADIADACLFLVSPAARWITGINLVVDGGACTRPIF